MSDVNAEKGNAEEEISEEIILERLRLCGRTMFALRGGRSSVNRVVHILHESGPVTQRELQNRLRVVASSVSEMISGMEKDGLVIREKNPDDARQRLVRLTQKGEQLYAEYIAWERDLRLLKVLSQEEASQLQRILGKLGVYWQELLQKENENRKMAE